MPDPAPRRGRWLAPALLVLVAGGVAAYDVLGLPGGGSLRATLDLSGASPEEQGRLGELLLVPLASLVVVLVRLGLGLRMLGPFRPILIAIGLNAAGVVPGLVVFGIVTCGVVLVRPALAGGWLPYFGRISSLLAAVVAGVLALVLLGRALEFEVLSRAGHLPIVVLCLASDGFARALANEGVASALWRAGVTLACAFLVLGLLAVPGLEAALLRWPELVLVEVAALLVVPQALDLRLLEHWNPAASADPGSGDSARDDED